MKFLLVLAPILLMAFSPFFIEVEKEEYERLKKLEVKWATTLNMNDWNITLKLGTKEELDKIAGRQCLGLSTWDPKTMTGTIYVLKQISYTAEIVENNNITSIRADQEDTIIHEMMHVIIRLMQEESAVILLSRLVNR